MLESMSIVGTVVWSGLGGNMVYTGLDITLYIIHTPVPDPGIVLIDVIVIQV